LLARGSNDDSNFVWPLFKGKWSRSNGDDNRPLFLIFKESREVRRVAGVGAKPTQNVALQESKVGHPGHALKGLTELHVNPVAAQIRTSFCALQNPESAQSKH
jgi:hypothetical protein